MWILLEPAVTDAYNIIGMSEPNLTRRARDSESLE
jgi:hypothetical protein